MQKSRKEPEVIVFEEPKYIKRKRSKHESEARKIFLDGSVADVFAFGNSDSGEDDDKLSGSRDVKKKRGLEADDNQDFRSIFRDVQKFAASTLTGREKWTHVKERIKALGGEERKKCVPYPVYQEMIKQKRQQERNDGMTSSKKKKELSKPKGKGRWKDRLTSLDPPVGQFKKGILKLTEPDIKKFR